MDDDCGGIKINDYIFSPPTLGRLDMTTVYADSYAVGGVVQMSDIFTANPTGNLRIILEDGDYRSNNVFTRDNVTVLGVAKPELSDDTNSLVGGSIIKGTFWIKGSGVHVEKFGVDRGVDVCTSLFSGVDSNALGLIGDSLSGGLKKDVSAYDVVGLCKTSSSPYHAFIAQGITKFEGQNIEGIFGQFGAVFKVVRANVNGIKGRRAGIACIYIKSDTAPNGEACNTSNFSDLQVFETANVPTYGVIAHASTAPMYAININNVNITGCDSAFAIVGDTRASLVNTQRRIIASNINIFQPVSLGFNCFGGIMESSVSGMNIYSPTSHKGIDVNSDCLGLRLTDTVVSLAATNTNPADAIKLQGRVWADGLHCIQNGDYATKRGIKDLRETGYNTAAGNPLMNVWGNVT